MKVFIVGGTGFIGYYTVMEFLKNEYAVTTISLPDIKIGDWFPKEVTITYGNVFEMNNDDLKEMFLGYDVMVYAIGPDDRYTPKKPAHEYFYKYLVEGSGRVVSAARQAGVKKCIVLNSYFSYFDRMYPERNLLKRHSYIKCRVAQATRVISEGKDLMDVVILELPYIFGCMPERVPLFKDILVKMLYEKNIIFFPKGGTNMIAVENVAKAIMGAAKKGEHGVRYTIGDVNMSWVDMIKIMLEAMDMSHKKIITIPNFLANIIGKKMKREEEKQGLESGLDLVNLFRDIQCRYSYFDPTESKEILGYNGGGIKKAIKDTTKACLEYLTSEVHN